MVIHFTEVNSLPDVLAANRHSLFFPQLPGVDARSLTLTKTRINLPQDSVGHIQARILGFTIGFRGGLSFDNVVSCSFLELRTGINIKSLRAWHGMVRNQADGSSFLKADYAKDGTFEIYDAMGTIAHSFTLVNMFPVVIQYPEFGEESTPAELQVQFNVDRVIDIGTGEALSTGEFNQRFGE